MDTPLDTEQLEVIVPVSTRFRDYAQRINDVFRIVAEAEARPEPEIIRSVADPYIDRQYSRGSPAGWSSMDACMDRAALVIDRHGFASLRTTTSGRCERMAETSACM